MVVKRTNVVAEKKDHLVVWTADVLVVRTMSIIIKQGMWNITEKLGIWKVTLTLKEVLLKVKQENEYEMSIKFGQWNWEIAEGNAIIGKEDGKD